MSLYVMSYLYICKCLYTCDCFICVYAIFGGRCICLFCIPRTMVPDRNSSGEIWACGSQGFSLSCCERLDVAAQVMAGSAWQLLFTSQRTEKRRKWQEPWLHTTFTGLHNGPLPQLGSCSWQFYHNTTIGGMSVQDTVLWWTVWIQTTGIVSVHCASRRNKESWEGLSTQRDMTWLVGSNYELSLYLRKGEIRVTEKIR